MMLGKQITLFKLFDFKVRIDVSWIIIVVLITWSLAKGVFPHYYEGLSAGTYWWMGVAGALGLFASIVLHELCHSLVARRFGLSIRGITLFIFGGVAEMEEEPPSAKAEFFMAIAGPISSIIIGLVLYGMSALSRKAGLPIPVTGVVSYSAQINWILAAFNLVPAFPLDGGRVFRSVLWLWKGNHQWATQVSAKIGSGFGFSLSFVGILFIIRGSFVSGIWMLLIGMFLHSASQVSYNRLLILRILGGEKVRRFMKSDPVVVASSISLDNLVENYVYKYHYKMFPVVDDGTLIGCISTREVKTVYRGEWSQRTVKEFTKPCSSANTIPSDTDAVKALSIMNQTRNSRLMVVEGNRLVGIITLKDLLSFLSLKMNLEGEEFKRNGLNLK